MVDYDGKTGLLLINHREYLRLYKDIIKTCLTDGYLLPALLEIIDVPEKYDWTLEEKKKFEITLESSQKREQMFMERELRYASIDVSIFDFKQHAEKSTIIENEELLEFISEYPEYEKILK